MRRSHASLMMRLDGGRLHPVDHAKHLLRTGKRGRKSLFNPPILLPPIQFRESGGCRMQWGRSLTVQAAVLFPSPGRFPFWTRGKSGLGTAFASFVFHEINFPQCQPLPKFICPPFFEWLHASPRIRLPGRDAPPGAGGNQTGNRPLLR